MAILNAHTQFHVRSWRELLRMIVAYRLPLCIFIAASVLTIGYNVFFCRLLFTVSHVSASLESLYHTLNAVHTDLFWLTFPATRRFSIFSLCLGDVFFTLMFTSFLRAIFTCPGYVPREPWRWPPKADAERQRSLREAWARQQCWMRDQEARAQLQAAHAQQLLQQQYQLWWSMQLAYLQQQQQQLQTMIGVSGSAPSTISFPQQNGISFGNSVARTPHAPPPSLSPQEDNVCGSHEKTPHFMTTLHAEDTVTVPMNSLPRIDPPAASMEASHLPKSSGDNDKSARPLFATSQTHAALSSSSASCRDLSPTSSVTDASLKDASSLAVAASAASSACGSTAYTRNTTNTAAALISAVTGCSPHLRPLAHTPQGPSLNPFTVHEYEADGSLRFCEVCHQYKPDSSHHCRACQRCVFDMDHHCYFLNNCVGRYNYKLFFLCVFYATLCGTVNSALFVFAYAGSAVCAEWGHGWWWVPAGMSSIGVCVSYLWVQHVFLLVRGVSTLDRMQQLASERFLAKVSGEHRLPGLARSGCHTDCIFSIRVCSCAVVQAVQHVFSVVTGAGGRVFISNKARLQPCPSSSAKSATDAMLTESKRRARRIALLFGQPQHWWEFLLPVAPHDDTGLLEEKAIVCVHVEAV